MNSMPSRKRERASRSKHLSRKSPSLRRSTTRRPTKANLRVSSSCQAMQARSHQMAPTRLVMR
jgi:hypothetical protein